MARRSIQGLILDSALIIRRQDDGLDKNQSFIGSLSLSPHVERLLLRLVYSSMRVGILFHNNDENFVQDIIMKSLPSGCQIDSKNTSDADLIAVLNEFIKSWDISPNECVFFSSYLDKSLETSIVDQGIRICISSGSQEIPQCIQELFCYIARVNKEVNHEVKIVGYTMKWSRELDFLKRFALPLNVIEKNLSFFPVNLELPLSPQMEVVDILLQKPTDEIISASLEDSGKIENNIKFTDGMQQSIRYLCHHPHVCLIDPIERIFPLLDRASTHDILQGLSALGDEKRKIRAPSFLKISEAEVSNFVQKVKDCGFSLPAIVKPQIACGISDAHKMAVVFKPNGFLDLRVPTPCVLQEYIDHGSKIYKFYVIGDKVFYSTRKSMPDARNLAESGNLSIPSAIVFDSLKSLPHQFVNNNEDISKASSLLNNISELDLDFQLVHTSAIWLRERLKLTIFGFDVVVQVNTNDHVIVDVNFFPTFKDVEDEKAIPAFWDALLMAYSDHNKLQSSTV